MRTPNGRRRWRLQMAIAAIEPRVPGASRWWAPSKAARPHFSKRSWRAPARSSGKARVEAGTTVGDASKEARHHKMSVEFSVATTTFMDDTYTFIDCPGSVEFVHDMRAVLPAVDAAVVVCEADERKMPQLQLDPARARRPQDSPLPVPQQDRQGRHQGDGGAADPAAGLARAAGAAPDPDLEERDRHRLRRSRARARPCLQGARGVRGRAARRREPRAGEDRALLHAGEARRPRRRADGAIARGHPAAARQGVRRSRQGTARRTGRSGADGRRHPHQRRAAAAQGAAPRGAERRGDRQAARRQRQRAARLCAQDVQHRACRQDVGRARAERPDRRRRHAAFAGARSRPRRRHLQDGRPEHREARRRERGRNGGARQARIRQGPATRCRPASRRMRR